MWIKGGKTRVWEWTTLVWLWSKTSFQENVRRKPEWRCALTVVCLVNVSERTDRKRRRRRGRRHPAGELFTLSVSFMNLVNGKARNSMSRAFGWWGKRNTDVHGQEVFCAGRSCGMCWRKIRAVPLSSSAIYASSWQLASRRKGRRWQPICTRDRCTEVSGAARETQPFPRDWWRSCFYILDAVDPFVLLFGRGGRDAIHHVVSFHHSPIGLRLAGFYQLSTVVGNVQLETVLERKRSALITIYSKCLTYFGSEKLNLTGFLGSSTSRILRFSNGMIPRGSLSCKIKGLRATVNRCYLNYMLNMLNKGIFYHNAEPKVNRLDVIWRWIILQYNNSLMDWSCCGTELILLMEVDQHLLWCTQSNKGSCLWE